MPWKECKPMDERPRFIARLLEGEQMASLCREFGISRVTGYKVYNRYKDCGLDALNDRSRAPSWDTKNRHSTASGDLYGDGWSGAGQHTLAARHELIPQDLN